ncbi:MAG: hypothetical protein ACFWTJ_09920 [Lachnoclostridium sp.]
MKKRLKRIITTIAVIAMAIMVVYANTHSQNIGVATENTNRTGVAQVKTPKYYPSVKS